MFRRRYKKMLRFLVLLVLGFLFLQACAPRRAPVAAPSTSEKKLKATQRPYSVNGQRYEPLRTHEGFVQTGIASWYGSDFHGKTTSNGETYDMHAMTAAHKTLPLGVFVRVRNRENGREAIVRLNDRGPFVKGRIIDLSYAAAKKLGVDAAGTAQVRIEALGYRQEGRPGYSSPGSFDQGTYTVQVGSFREYANARRLSDQLKNLFGFSELRPTNVNGYEFYRVYAGKYTSLRAAETAEINFSEHGYPGSFVVSLD